MIIKYFFLKKSEATYILGSTQFTFLTNLEDYRCVSRMLFFSSNNIFFDDLSVSFPLFYFLYLGWHSKWYPFPAHHSVNLPEECLGWFYGKGLYFTQ